MASKENLTLRWQRKNSYFQWRIGNSLVYKFLKADSQISFLFAGASGVYFYYYNNNIPKLLLITLIIDLAVEVGFFVI
jgi:hypothetical protein